MLNEHATDTLRHSVELAATKIATVINLNLEPRERVTEQEIAQRIYDACSNAS